MTALEFQQLADIKFSSGIMPLEKCDEWTDYTYAVKYIKFGTEHVLIFNLHLERNKQMNDKIYHSKSQMNIFECATYYKENTFKDFLTFNNLEFETFLGWYWDAYQSRYL